MNPLHLLPPETAHRVALLALKAGLGPCATADDPRLSFSLFGKTFSNPIGLAAGADKDAAALAGWARMGFGFVEAGTVTPLPRTGNKGTRVWRLGDGHLVNWMGLPGGGLSVFRANLEKFQKHAARKNLVVGASLAAPDGTAADFGRMAATLAPLVDYLTLNASCPNVADDALRGMREQVAAAAGHGVPLLVKLAPTRDMEALKKTAETALEAGAAGFVATNTVPFGKKELLPALPFAWPAPKGGYSGPLLLDISCAMIAALRDITGRDVPLMGVGGVQSGADALRLMQAGANAVQLYSGLVYKGAGLLRGIKRELSFRA